MTESTRKLHKVLCLGTRRYLRNIYAARARFLTRAPPELWLPMLETRMEGEVIMLLECGLDIIGAVNRFCQWLPLSKI